MPQITDSDENSVNLIWERPQSDGGSKIQGYQVEYRDPRDGRWKPASDQLVKDTSFRGIIKLKMQISDVVSSITDRESI